MLVALSALLLAGVAAGCGDSASSETARCRDFKFDHAAWRRDSSRTQGGLTDRQRLADGLLRCRILIGKTRREVRALLGPRERIDSSRDFWSYNIGLDRGPVKVDFEMLGVRFGPDGRVRSASRRLS